jgi:hypothetical protein
MKQTDVIIIINRYKVHLVASLDYVQEKDEEQDIFAPMAFLLYTFCLPLQSVCSSTNWTLRVQVMDVLE